MRIKEYLEKGHDLYHTLDMICNQYESMKAIVEKTTSSMDGERVSGSSSPDSRENAIIQLMAIKDELQDTRNDLLRFQMDAGRLFRLINPADCMDCMMDYYIRNYSVHKIAQTRRYTDDWIRKRLRYGENFLQTKLGDDWEPPEMKDIHV